MIGKWLHAGVLEDGAVTYPDAGTPQGGVLSPLLANVFLHEVLDGWFEHEVQPRLQGQAFLVRYADDATMRQWCSLVKTTRVGCGQCCRNGWLDTG